MAASPVPGDRPSATGFRRASSQFATVPHRSLSFHEKAGLAKDDAAAEVLYTHPNIRIYSFQPPTDALKTLDKTKKTLPDADYPIDAIEILPWRSRTETISAKGKLLIEKVQGSVHFLKAGDLIHTIMKNSQCWCVDGESKFVMRIGRLRYQRIEFPTAESEEKQKVEEFKEVISKILKFEKTPCPFIRGFQVDLPDDAITPRRRGTWKRKESLTSTPVDEEAQQARRSKASRSTSMRGMPPTAFPTRSMTYIEMDRPRTASTPTGTSTRFSFPDVRSESPTTYTSGEENTDSDRHDSESDRPESSQHSEVEESDRENNNVPIIRSPLKNVETIASNDDRKSSRSSEKTMPPPNLRRGSSVDQHVKLFERFKMPPEPPSKRIPRPTSPSRRRKEIDPSQIAAAETNDAPQLNGNLVSDSVAKQIERSLLSRLPEQNSIKSRPKDRGQDDLVVRHEVGSQKTEALQDVQDPPNTVPDHPAPEPNKEKVLFVNVASDPVLPAIQDTQSESHPDATRSDTSPVPEREREPAALDPPLELLQKESDLKEPDEQNGANDELTKTQTNDDAASTMSTDSFHSSLSLDDRVPGKFTMTSLNTRPFQHRREISEMTITEASMENDRIEQGQPSSAVDAVSPVSPEPTRELAEFERAPRASNTFTDTSEIRKRLKHRRSLSPLPPASILRPPSPSDQTSQISTLILQKAAALAVVKPIEVVLFVFHVLSRIASGATMNDLVSGDLFRRPGGPRRTASGTFESSIREQPPMMAGENGNEDEEDDYGLPVLGRRRSSNILGHISERTASKRDDDTASNDSID